MAEIPAAGVFVLVPVIGEFDHRRLAFARELDIVPHLVSGGRGEFTIWLDGTKVFDKGHDDFPDEAEVIAAIRAAVR